MKTLFRLLRFKSESRNITYFYLMTIAINAFFIASNWIYFWTRYMTFGELGWVDGLGFGFALLLEIPSGAIADLVGKKRTIQIGFLAGGIGTLLIAGATSMTQILIGWLIAQICYALYSGAAEALTYDTLLDLKREDEYDRIISQAESLGMYAGALATFLGGLAFSIGFRLPHLLWSASFFAGFLLSLKLIEPKVDTTHFSLKMYFEQLRLGVRELFHPDIQKFVIFFFILSGTTYMYSWGFLRPAVATYFGFHAVSLGVIFPVITLLGATAVRFLPQIRKRIQDFPGLVLASVLLAVSFFLIGLPIGYWGVLVMLAIAVLGDIAKPWLSAVVNARIPSRYRATTLSTAALLNRLPYVLVAVLSGVMIENGQLTQFSIGVGGVILFGIVLSFVIAALQKPRITTT